MRRAERERSRHPKSSPICTVFKYGACLGLLALLALIGSHVNDNFTTTGDSSGLDYGSASTHKDVRAAAHRKLVFDERRARFEGATPAQSAMDSARIIVQPRIIPRAIGKP
jgi:hypothetical protein